MKEVIAKNTLTNDMYIVSDELKVGLLDINSRYKYYYESDGYTILFIPVDHDDKYGHTYKIENKLYETLYTNPIDDLENMSSDLKEIQLSLF